MNRPFLLALLVLLALSGNSAMSDSRPLGRLFFSPGQRAAMDQLKSLDAQSPGRQEQDFTFNGALYRKHGPSIYWGNGRRLPEDASLPRKIPVGDTLNGNTGQTESILRGGSITITPGNTRK